MAKDEQTKANEAEAAKSGGKGFVIGLAAAALIAAGAGAGLAFMLAPQFAEAKRTVAEARAAQAAARKKADSSTRSEKTEKEHGAGEASLPGERVDPDIYTGDVTLVRLKPIMTNLRQPFHAWVRLEGALILREEHAAEDSADGEGKAQEGEKKTEGEGEKQAGEGGQEASADVEKGGVPALAALIQEDAHAYLRTLALKDLEGAGNLAWLRDDLTERAAIRSGGRVKEFVILSLVVEE